MKYLQSFLLLALWIFPSLGPAKDIQYDPELDKQIGKIFEQIQKIKVGMTRSDLDKLFTVAGGLRSSKPEVFMYRSCFHIKVDVDFTSADKGNPTKPNQNDTIIMISRPYLSSVDLD